MTQHIRSIREARICLRDAKSDLSKLKLMQARRDNIKSTQPLHVDMVLVDFYVTQWPELMRDSYARHKWSDQLDTRTEEVESYIKQVEAWCERVKDRPVRCSLPKKRQREMGLLPTVEQEVAIREGRL